MNALKKGILTSEHWITAAAMAAGALPIPLAAKGVIAGVAGVYTACRTLIKAVAAFRAGTTP